MPSNFTKIIACATVMLGLTASGAQAINCLQSETAGNWQSYTLASNSVGTFWLRCQLVVNTAGVIASTTCNTSAGAVVAMTEGKLSVLNNSRCSFTGSFKIAGVRNLISRATMSQDKISVEGVGTFPNGGVFMFGLTKY